MRNFRILLTLFSFFLITSAASAQNKKTIEQATEKVEALNQELTAIAAEYTLTEDQQKQANTIFLNGLVEIKVARKEAADKEAGKEAVKPLRKTMNKAIRKEVLTKAQKKALKEARAKK